MKIIISFSVLVFLIIICLTVLRTYDELQNTRKWKDLLSCCDAEPERFTAALVKNLPEPAQRYFKFVIMEGTPLFGKVELMMNGVLGLGPKEKPDYMSMKAQQLIDFPMGFIWNVKSGRGALSISGSDGFFKDQSWSRFWIMNSIPVGRVKDNRNGNNDHRRAAFGRLVAETVFWSPAALLTYEKIEWEVIDQHAVRATIKYDDLIQTVSIYLDENTDQPVKVIIPRWSDANPQETYQLQPFGGYLSEYRMFNGFRIPTHVEGGNYIGTDDYFPFYIADIETAKFGPQ